VLDLETAVTRILAALPAPQGEQIGLTEAAGRMLLAAVTAPVDLPPFDNSAMDGYAVRAADVTDATATTPVPLRLRARIAAGEIFSGKLEPGECLRLFTGAPMPSGADAVVMQEDTWAAGDSVLILDAVRAGENVRWQGEDVRRDAKLAAAGDEITAGLIGLLGATGIENVCVARQPVVGLLATGSELMAPGQTLTSGQIYESNRAMLATLVEEAGGRAKIFPLVRDTLAETKSALATAFQECDIIITSGGVSVGEMDFVKAAFESLGGELQFWQVAMRPGKPFVFGRWKEKYLFGLPGNPVSAFVTFWLLARPALRQWQGARQTSAPVQAGILGEAVSNPSARRHFMRVRFDAEGKVFSAGKQASHVLSSLALAEGLLDLAAGAQIAAGTPVQVFRLR